MLRIGEEAWPQGEIEAASRTVSPSGNESHLVGSLHHRLVELERPGENSDGDRLEFRHGFVANVFIICVLTAVTTARHDLFRQLSYPSQTHTFNELREPDASRLLLEVLLAPTPLAAQRRTSRSRQKGPVGVTRTSPWQVAPRPVAPLEQRERPPAHSPALRPLISRFLPPVPLREFA